MSLAFLIGLAASATGLYTKVVCYESSSNVSVAQRYSGPGDEAFVDACFLEASSTWEDGLAKTFFVLLCESLFVRKYCTALCVPTLQNLLRFVNEYFFSQIFKDFLTGLK